MRSKLFCIFLVLLCTTPSVRANNIDYDHSDYLFGLILHKLIPPVPKDLAHFQVEFLTAFKGGTVGYGGMLAWTPHLFSYDDFSTRIHFGAAPLTIGATNYAAIDYSLLFNYRPRGKRFLVFEIGPGGQTWIPYTSGIPSTAPTVNTNVIYEPKKPVWGAFSAFFIGYTGFFHASNYASELRIGTEI
jgi:hypothetical protein